MKETVLVLGATSAMATATAHALAHAGYPLFLAGRDRDEVARLAADMRIRHGVRVDFGAFDVLDTKAHPGFLDRVIETTGGLAGVLLAVGLLGDQPAAERDFGAAREIIETNYLGAVSILSRCADHLQSKGAGFIIALSSVAGDRGRQSNFVYGSAKAGLNTYLQGLRNRLHPSGVRVITVKPGFVDTAMTFGLPGMFLVAQPQRVGQRIARAVQGRADVVYVPWFWRWIMWIIRGIPEAVFKRLKL